MLPIVEYDYARRTGLPRYFSGKACLHGHTAERWTRNNHCVVCYPNKKPMLSAEDQLRRQERCRAEAKQRAEEYGLADYPSHYDEARALRARSRYLDRLLADQTDARLAAIKQEVVSHDKKH
jgi:hypothetical protein